MTPLPEELPERRRARALTPEDIEEIKTIARTCPHGMTAQDVFKLREFLEWWDETKGQVGGWVIKIMLALIVAVGVLVAWITQGKQ
jgi:hypothetical protein